MLPRRPRLAAVLCALAVPLGITTSAHANLTTAQATAKLSKRCQRLVKVKHPSKLRKVDRKRRTACLKQRKALMAGPKTGPSLPVTTSPITAPTPNPSVVPATPSSGLIMDKAAHPMTAVSKPAVRQAFTDPQFGTRIVRVTDVAAQFGSEVAVPAYSTIPAWNADESLLLLYVTHGTQSGYALFDGHTYAFLRWLPIDPTDVEHWEWSSTNPDVIYYPHAAGNTTREFVEFHVSTGAKTVLHNFTGANGPSVGAADMGSDPMYGSWDNQLFGMRLASGSPQGFLFNAATGAQSTPQAGDAPQVAPSGRRYVLGTNVYETATGGLVRPLKGDPLEHATQTQLANGEDARVSVQFDGTTVGSVVVENLTTGAVQSIVGPDTGYPYPPSGTHLSGHAFRAPGWVAVSVIGTGAGQTLLDNELLLVNANTGAVYRVGHARTANGSAPQGYWAEPHVNISPSGTRMIFGSDWGGGQTVDSYVVELPSYTG